MNNLDQAARARRSGDLAADVARQRKEREMRMTRNIVETSPGPGDWFTGSVSIDAITAPTGASGVGAASVHFTPGARTAWHTHPCGQTIWVTECVGLCQREGGTIEFIRPGDRVFFEPDESHWHGAAAARFMTQIAIQQADEQGNVVDWGEHVSDERFAQAPALEAGEG